jgi:hypothetical protein
MNKMIKGLFTTKCCCGCCGVIIIGYIIYTIVSGFSDIFSNINITGSLTIVSLLGLGIIFKSKAPTSEEMMKFKNKQK